MSTREALVVFHDFEEYPSGAEPDHWPMHLTIVPYFGYEGLGERAVVDRIAARAKEIGSIVLEPGGQALYGRDHDIPVTKIIDQGGRLKDLHLSLIEDLSEMGCRFGSLMYGRDKYSPHVTDTALPLNLSGPYVCNAISVAKKVRRRRRMERTVVERILL